jgi:hypothetical protein
MLVRNNTTCPSCGNDGEFTCVAMVDKARLCSANVPFRAVCSECDFAVTWNVHIDVAYELLMKAWFHASYRSDKEVDFFWSLARKDYSRRYLAYIINDTWGRLVRQSKYSAANLYGNKFLSSIAGTLFRSVKDHNQIGRTLRREAFCGSSL